MNYEEENQYLKEILSKVNKTYIITGNNKDEDFNVVRRSIIDTLRLANEFQMTYNTPNEPLYYNWGNGQRFFDFSVKNAYNDLKDAIDIVKKIKDKISWCELELVAGNYGARKYEYLQDIKSVLKELLDDKE